MKINIGDRIHLVNKLVTRSLKSLRNPRNTYKLNSAKEIETINHIFHHYTIAWSFLGRLMNWFGSLGCLHRDPNHNLQEWFGSVKDNFQRHVITLLYKGLYWFIWTARNCLIFKSKPPDWDVIFDLTFHRLAFWLKSPLKISTTQAPFFLKILNVSWIRLISLVSC